ncbi:MerR family transcriptional regulator [Lachnospiraceae bacterium LCP25S3_G4]
MTIKEVEKMVGISSDNIRYYEKEHLIHPLRNVGNNYRDYSQADIETLKKIKLLRVLDISISDIKRLMDGTLTLEEALEVHAQQLKEQKKHLEDLESVYRNILYQNLDYWSLDGDLLKGKEEIFKERLNMVLKLDTSKVNITKRHMNRLIGGMLVYAFIVNAILCFWVGGYFFYEAPEVVRKVTIFVYFLISVFCGVMVYWNAKASIQTILFQLATLSLAPATLSLITMFRLSNMDEYVKEQYYLYSNNPMDAILTSGSSSDLFLKINPYHLGIFMFMIAIYTVLLLIASEISKQKVFLKLRYGMIVVIIYTILGTVTFYYVIGNWLLPLICIGSMTLYITAFWHMINIEKQQYNKYYAISAATNMINIGAMIMSREGTTRSWRRGEDYNKYDKKSN